MSTFYQSFQKYSLCHTNDVTYEVKHIHSHCEVIHMVKGSAIVNVDGKEYKLTDNTVIVIEPHRIHHMKSDWFNEVYLSFISPQLIPSVAETMHSHMLENPVFALDESKVRICTGMLEYIIEKFRNYPRGGLAYRRYIDNKAASETPFVKHMTESYMSLILEDAVWIKKTSSNADNARKILEYCLNNYNKDISLGKIAEEIGITEATVTRVFGSIVKCPFRTYINNLRLADVESKLTETDMPITKISESCGFETMRTFNRVFLSSYGLTPSQYRKRYKENNVNI